MFDYKVFSTGINATIEEALNSCVEAGYEPISHHIDINKRVTIIGKKREINIHIAKKVDPKYINTGVIN